MSIHVDKDWWKHLFDDAYLQTDARSVCNVQLTHWEVDYLEKVLHEDKSAPILDLCGGQGRHSLELTRRGFTNVIVLDYSAFLVGLGKKGARQEDLVTTFIRGDGRTIGLRTQSFATIMIMGSSFGYFINDQENKKILDEAFRLLRPAGKLLLDLPDREFVLRTFKPVVCHQVNEDIMVTRTRELRKSLICSRETVTSIREGCIRDRTYCMHLYSRGSISKLLGSAGFTSLAFKNDFMPRESEGDYGSMTKRVIIMAKKPEKL